MQIEALMPPGLVDEGRKLIEASVPKNAEGAEVKYLTTLAATLALVAVFERGRAAIDFPATYIHYSFEQWIGFLI